MMGLYIFVGIGLLTVSIFMIIKFFQIASDVRDLKMMALTDYRLKLLTTPENCELKKLIADMEINEAIITDELPDWIKIKLDEGIYATAEKRFGLWCCADLNDNVFYFAKRSDAIKALCYFQVQK